MNTMILERKWFTDISTIGELRLDGNLFCFVLEDTCRANGVKIAGKTAISSGTYEVIINHSDRFNRQMPLLLNVPDFDGVRIHCGNTDKDTEGCLLVGTRHDVDDIFDSKRAFDQLFPEIQKRTAMGKFYISIIGGKSPKENQNA